MTAVLTDSTPFRVVGGEDAPDSLSAPHTAADESYGASLLHELRDAISAYVAMPSAEALDAVVLWIATTHIQGAFSAAPRLVVKSPERRCGKTRLLDIIEQTCHRPFAAFNATMPAVVQSIDEDDPPTLIFDEADAIWPKSGSRAAEGLRALLNAGFQRGRPIVRCGSGKNARPEKLPSFAMAVLAGIGDTIPSTVTDRAVVIRMRRRLDEDVLPFRISRDSADLKDIGRRLSEWLSDHADALRDAEPVLPVSDRAADVWEPLVAVADLAGDYWSARSRSVCSAMVAAVEDDPDDTDPSQRILSAARDVFDSASSDRLTTETFLRDLASAGIDLDAYTLSSALRPFEIRPRNLKMATGNVRKGYRRSDFTDAWKRYL